MRRTAFQAFKRLGAFFAYADAGTDGTNPTWPVMGYELGHEAVTADPPAVRPLPDDGGSEPLGLDADVVVVGSGAGGGVVAARLAEAGRAVLVIEAGSYVPESDLSANELDGFDRLYLDHGLVATADLSIAILAGGTLGGGTTVNWMTSIPLPDRVRHRWAVEFGLDGPGRGRGGHRPGPPAHRAGLRGPGQHAAQGPADPRRRPCPGLGSGPHGTRRLGLRRLRRVRLRLPAGGQAVGAAAAPRRRRRPQAPASWSTRPSNAS